MIIELDFTSEEALYLQVCHQIIMGIATSRIHKGDSLPSVRSLAEEIGINMHTVNKAYSVLKDQGFVTIDRRHGAIVSTDCDHARSVEKLREELLLSLARSYCKDISRQEIHDMVDEIYDGLENS